MKAVIKDNTKILLSKLNSQELAVLENFITKSVNYKAEISKLDNIDGEIDGINFKITNELKNQISYESPYNIVLLPRTVANIDLKVESDVTVEVINNYEDYLDTSIENNIISVSLKEVPELKDKCINYNLGIKLSKEDYNDINLNIIVCGIYSLSGATKLSDLENDMGFIDNTVDDLVNYYTKTETDNLLDTKQDTLTAGTNITIENGTISAVDTIYDDTKLRNDISNIESNISNIESDINNLEFDKVDKIQGKGLSTEDFTTEEKIKLASLENYDDTQIRDEITTLNSTKADKSEIPTDVSELNNDANYATTSYADDNFLKKTNTTSYTPTGNYNPATKKYVDDNVNTKQNTLTAGENITITNDTISATDTVYDDTEIKSDITLICNDITDLDTNKADKSEITDFITKSVNDLTYYTLATNTGSTIDLEINSSTYIVTLSLKNSAGTVISTDTIDLPLESVVVNGSYDSTNKKIVLTLQSGSTIDIPVSDLVSGLQSEITSNNKLSSDLVDDTNNTNKFVTSNEKTAWNAKYDKPSGGIPSTDLSSSVQTSLGLADTALQSFTETDPVFNASPAANITSNDITTWNNKGTYSKPQNGIPKTDLDSDVQTSLGLADTAMQPNVLGRTNDFNSNSNALSIDGLNRGMYVLKGGNSNYFYIKHNTGSAISTLRIDLPYSIPVLLVFGVVLFIDRKVTEGDNTTGSFGSVQLNFSDSVQPGGVNYWRLLNIGSGGTLNLGSSGSSSFNWEINTNKVTSLSNSSTDTQYPSAKCVYDNLSGKQDIIQYSTMPTASSSTVGKIVQYIGTTDSTYSNGYFYIGTTDGASTPTYSWTQLDVQPSSGGGDNVKLYWLNLNNIPESQTITDQTTLDILDDIITDYENNKIVFFENRISLNHSTQNFYIVDSKFTSNNETYYLFDEISRSLVVDDQVWGYTELYLKQTQLSYNSTTKKMSKTGGYTSERRKFIDTNVTYQTTFMPSKDCSPATKKYVDDSISSAITDALTGSY